MRYIEASEFILNDRGAVYHLDLRPEELAPLVITVGDPARVQQVSSRFDSVEFKTQHREFITHTGWLGRKRISVLSTGIGTDNIDIVLNEIDALVNIDLATRSVKSELASLQILRLGTSGALQSSIPLDSMVVGTHGIGIDNLLNFYRFESNEEERQLLQAFLTHTQLNASLTQPYVASASASLLKHFTGDFHHGITVTCPGFYGPQGRVLRLGLQFPQLLSSFNSFRYGQRFIANFEMETSAIYGLGRALGHHCLSLNVVVANRITKEFTGDGRRAVERLIEKALAILSGI